ncbi:MAG: hypothetical protein MI976_00440 [Pseudomonadales bacterium]|nr:hypothetical protein [Pseudomonadales bacterium]
MFIGNACWRQLLVVPLLLGCISCSALKLSVSDEPKAMAIGSENSARFDPTFVSIHQTLSPLLPTVYNQHDADSNLKVLFDKIRIKASYAYANKRCEAVNELNSASLWYLEMVKSRVNSGIGSSADITLVNYHIANLQPQLEGCQQAQQTLTLWAEWQGIDGGALNWQLKDLTEIPDWEELIKQKPELNQVAIRWQTTQLVHEYRIRFKANDAYRKRIALDTQLALRKKQEYEVGIAPLMELVKSYERRLLSQTEYYANRALLTMVFAELALLTGDLESLQALNVN